jgi:hypothetical protein
MGGAKRYPSYGDDGFRRLNPSYILWTIYGVMRAALVCRRHGVMLERDTPVAIDVAQSERRRKRYPSIASYGDDGFRRLNSSYVL